MSQRISSLFLSGLLLSLPAVAQEPPDRLQRKPRPAEPEPEKLTVMPRPEGQPPAEPEPQPMRSEASLEETLARLTRNLEKTDERLQQKDVSAKTRNIQIEIVLDFDTLIEQMLNQQQQQQQQQKKDASAKQESKSQPEPLAKKDAGKQPQFGEKPQQGKQSQQGEQPREEQASNERGGYSPRTAEEQKKLAALYKDVWGHLPDTVRQQMDAYGREQFMPKYSELLKQYYSTLSEKGRQKGRD